MPISRISNSSVAPASNALPSACADRAGHRHGPESPEVEAALARQDAELAHLLEALDALGRWDEITLIVVSDHGMGLATEGIDLAAILAAHGIAGEIQESTAAAFVHLEDPKEAPTARAALDAHPAVVLRPDRYVFGVVDEEWDLDRLLAELGRKLALR